MHIAPRLAALNHLAEAVKVELPLEAAELVVCFSSAVGTKTRRDQIVRVGTTARKSLAYYLGLLFIVCLCVVPSAAAPHVVCQESKVSYEKSVEQGEG